MLVHLQRQRNKSNLLTRHLSRATKSTTQFGFSSIRSASGTSRTVLLHQINLPSPLVRPTRWTHAHLLSGSIRTRTRSSRNYHNTVMTVSFSPTNRAPGAPNHQHKMSFSTRANLEYQQWPQVNPTRIGRYIDREFETDNTTKTPIITHVDEHKPTEVTIRSGREFDADLDKEGFTFVQNRELPTACEDFSNPDLIKTVYYDEIKNLVKEKLQCDKVLVFDHTLRNSGKQNLNVLTDTKAAAAAVQRVHCDYTADSAPIRIQQLSKTETYTGERMMTEKDCEDILKNKKRFCFINLWRSIDRENCVKVKPLAVCDYQSVDWKNDMLLYELVYKDRVGENYSLSPHNAQNHRWYYYPDMTADEIIMFKVYDRNQSKAPFVFHTAFEDPNTNDTDPNRKSIEVRAIAIWDEEKVPSMVETKVEVMNNQPTPCLYDMVHSNNSARCRLWLQLKGVPKELCDMKMITYADINSPDYLKVNPLKKIPAMQAWRKCVKKPGDSPPPDSGTDDPSNKKDIDRVSYKKETAWNYYYESLPLFESHVIMQYLEDKFGKAVNPDRIFVPQNPEDNAVMNLLIRVHDIYISSPNCTQPNFAHTQGCMYLAPYPTKWCAPERCMDKESRSKKLKEIWKHLCWLDCQLELRADPYMCGEQLTHADMTWFPTVCFMEYLLPNNFQWADITKIETDAEANANYPNDANPFPFLALWFQNMRSKHKEFDEVRTGVYNFFHKNDLDGMFESIRNETKDTRYKWHYSIEDLDEERRKSLTGALGSRISNIAG
ncbi:unnamed protein product [Amoebophrya sp. A120]|nr:unnamed protein product [Amoebophrya sp. A120]|eukprot:GSA120T00022003001.1